MCRDYKETHTHTALKHYDCWHYDSVEDNFYKITYRQWFELLNCYEMESRPLDNNLKITTLVNGRRGKLQQHLLLSFKPTTTWSQAREIVENCYSSVLFVLSRA